VFEREATIYRRLWRASVFTAFVGPVMFLAAMGLGLGGLVEQGAGQVDGLSYLVFVTPGLLAASSMQIAAGESLWPVMGGMKWLRTFHGMVSTPLGPGDVYTGNLAFTGFRVGMSGSVFLVVATALGGVASPWAVLAIPAAVLTGLAFAAPLAAFAATRETDQSFALTMRLVIAPLFLFSGTFFPISQLPPVLEALAVISPLWHGIELCRAATTGEGDPLALAGHVLVLVAVIAVSWRVGVAAFDRKLAQ
jgi:lipooligosaccharide transport system permease protein